MRLVGGLITLLLAVSTPSVGAQDCRSNIAESTPTARFLLHDDGTLTDTANHLRWQRCATGQRWGNNRCEGAARQLTISEAQQNIGHGWRLPSLSEPSGLVELRCSQPAINLRLFPNTPAANFWSATDFANSATDGPRVWQVQFIYGETNLGGAQDRAYLRGVKDTD